MDAHFVDVLVSASGTTGDFALPAGYRLVGLELPALDSTTVKIGLGRASGTYVAARDAAGAEYTIGGVANVGSRIIPVPAELSLLALAYSHARLTVASQTSGAVTIKAIFAKAGV